MTGWLELGLSNALVATAVALVVVIVTRFVRHPKVVFMLWVLVLAKLLMPPLWQVAWRGWPVGRLVEASPAVAIEPVARSDAEAPSSFEQPAAELASATVEGVPSAEISPAGSPPVAERLPEPEPTTAASRATRSSVVTPSARGFVWRVPSWPVVLGIVWIGGSLAWLTLAVVRIIRFRRALGRARVAPDGLRNDVAAVAEQMGVRRVPAVRVVGAALPPLVWSLSRRPTVVLPAALVVRLSREELETLVAHELAHIARRDHLVRLLEMVALCLYWWHPVAWLARRQLERAGEECCDAAVMARFPAAGRHYARALLATVDFLADARPALPVAASGVSQVSLLRRRLEMILTGTVVRRVSWPLRVSLAALTLVVLPSSIQSVSAAPKEFVPRRGSIEQRLDRLEQAMQDLTREIRTMYQAQQKVAPATVVKTVPENGAKSVNPNVKEIRVTFSREMQDGSWSWVGGGETFPETTGEPRYLKDKRTCVLPVKLKPNTTYHIGINSGRFGNFKDSRGMSSIPFALSFKTR